MLFDHGHAEVYTATREQLGQQQEAKRAPPAAAPSPAAAAEVAREFGSGWAAPAAAASGAAAATGRRHHRAPPPAAPAAAAEPNAAPVMPSEPCAQPSAATVRGGAGLDVSGHGFAAELQADVLQETPAGDLLPQASMSVLCRGAAVLHPRARQELLASGPPLLPTPCHNCWSCPLGRRWSWVWARRAPHQPLWS